MKINNSSAKQGGFTLLEVVITVVIIGILSAIAWPMYQNYVVKARRQAAGVCIIELSQYMERFYTTNMKYSEDSSGSANAVPNLNCIQSLNDFYTFTFEDLTSETYSVIATPQGIQASGDSSCGSLSISQSGQKGITGSGTLGKCW